MIIFGTYFGGKIKEVNNQWLETKFLLIMVPLVPLSTMFVTSSQFNSRNGFEVPVTGKSVLHGYLRFFTFIIAVAAWGVSLTGYSRHLNNDMPLPVYVIAGIASLLYSWSYFEHKKAKGQELLDRVKLGAALDINALPEWIPLNTRMGILHSLKDKVVQEFETDNITEILKRHSFTDKQIALLYAYVRYKCADGVTASDNDNRQLQAISFKYDSLIAKNATMATPIPLRP